MMKGYYTEPKERGVSESIGFLLIFTIVIAGIGLVTLYGYPMLLQQQVSADEKIMEKNMIVLQNDIKSLAYKTVPYKETSLKIGGGSLTVYAPSYISPSKLSTLEISYDGTPYLSFQPGELRYESISAQTDISLENGAVILRPRNQGSNSGSVMLAEPRWFYDKPTNMMVISLINITSDNLIAKEGIGTVRMKLGKTVYPDTLPAANVITLVYKPGTGQDYSVAWDNYIMKMNTPDIKVTRSGTPGTGTALTYTFTPSIAPTKLAIKQYEVKIESL